MFLFENNQLMFKILYFLLKIIVIIKQHILLFLVYNKLKANMTCTLQVLALK